MNERFSAYAGMGAALVAVALIVVIFFSPAKPEPIGPIEVATLETVSTPKNFSDQLEGLIPESFTASSTSFEELFVEPIVNPGKKPSPAKPETQTAPEATAPALTPPAVTTPKVEVTKEEVVPVATPKPPEPEEEEPVAALSVQDASVNILCSAKDKSLPSVSGSGVIIDSSGVIITVAHIAQLFLLEDYPKEDNVTCAIRTGSPAKNAYSAKLIYISQNWVKNNPNTLTVTNPSGTGEYDVALLVITGSLTSTPLPKSFPAVPLTHKDPKKEESAIIGAYGAQTLSSKEVRDSLNEIMVGTTVKKLFTFGDHTYDLISFGGNEAAQSGSSGGGVVNLSGEVIAIITTSTIKGDFATRNVSGITPNYIRRIFTQETGKNLDSYITSASATSLASAFAEDAKELAKVIIKAIEKD